MKNFFKKKTKQVEEVKKPLLVFKEFLDEMTEIEKKSLYDYFYENDGENKIRIVNNFRSDNPYPQIFDSSCNKKLSFGIRNLKELYFLLSYLKLEARIYGWKNI